MICTTRNATHAVYWPVVFNVTRWPNFFFSNVWFAYNASCQANATGAKPMLAASCVSIITNKSCSLDDISLMPIFQVRLDLENAKIGRVNRLEANMSVAVWNATLSRVDTHLEGIYRKLIGSRAFLFQYELFDVRQSALSSLLLINDSSSDYWYFSFGFVVPGTNFVCSSMDQLLWGISFSHFALTFICHVGR